jgi:putative intracellular protease/amidase
MEKKALIVVTSNDRLGNSGKTGWYLSEVSHVYYPLKDAGFTIEFASPKGGVAPLDESSRDLDDPKNKQLVSELNIKEGLKTRASSEFKPDNFDLIYFAGGHGTMWDFPHDEDLQKIAADIYERGGMVAAVCHGPAALVNLKLSNGNYLVKDMEVNSFTDKEEKEVGKDDVVPFSLESKLRERGAKFQAADNWGDKVVVSERLITGQNPQSAASLAKKIVEEFKKLEGRSESSAKKDRSQDIRP